MQKGHTKQEILTQFEISRSMVKGHIRSLAIGDNPFRKHASDRKRLHFASFKFQQLGAMHSEGCSPSWLDQPQFDVDGRDRCYISTLVFEERVDVAASS